MLVGFILFVVRRRLFGRRIPLEYHFSLIIQVKQAKRAPTPQTPNITRAHI